MHLSIRLVLFPLIPFNCLVYGTINKCVCGFSLCRGMLLNGSLFSLRNPNLN